MQSENRHRTHMQIRDRPPSRSPTRRALGVFEATTYRNCNAMFGTLIPRRNRRVARSERQPDTSIPEHGGVGTVSNLQALLLLGVPAASSLLASGDLDTAASQAWTSPEHLNQVLSYEDYSDTSGDSASASPEDLDLSHDDYSDESDAYEDEDYEMYSIYERAVRELTEDEPGSSDGNGSSSSVATSASAAPVEPSPRYSTMFGGWQVGVPSSPHAPEDPTFGYPLTSTARPHPAQHTLHTFTATSLTPLFPCHTHYPPPGTSCSICRDLFTASHPPLLVTLPGCNHIFGYACLRSSIGSGLPNSNKCPMCRSEWFAMDQGRLVMLEQKWKNVGKREREAERRIMEE
jgi:hypothetical protein